MLFRPDRSTAGLVLAVLGILAPSVLLAEVTAVRQPQTVASTSGQNATLGIPRWKGHVDPADPDRMWLCFAHGSSTGGNVLFSPDGGHDWLDTGMHPGDNAYLDYHVALIGDGSDLYFTFPGEGIEFRRFRAPAESNDDREALRRITGTSPYHRSSITMDGDGRLFVFTRNTDQPSANVRYAFSDDQGATWIPGGMAVETGCSAVRIGSMRLHDGRACLVVLHLMDPRGYEYYVWNGEGFEARPDHSIWAHDVGYSRAFTHNVVGDTMHLIVAYGHEMHHFWKPHDDGHGEWRHDIVFTEPNTDGMEMRPSCTVRGDELFLFYCRWTGGGPQSSRIYARVWDRATTSWSGEIAVSGAATSTNVHPNTCFQVPLASASVPVFWTAGPGGDQVVFTALELSDDDEVPPATIDDLVAVEGDAAGQVELAWTAPGDDGGSGQAAAYDIRHAETVLTELRWAGAEQVVGEPQPAEAGQPESMTVDGLEPGRLYYFGIKTLDDQQNVSPLSNVPRLNLPDEQTAAGDLPRLGVLPNYPNPFNPRTTIPFVLPGERRVRLSVYDTSGRLVRVLNDGVTAAGRHAAVWDGRGRRGQAMPSGTYHVRLRVGREVFARRISLIR